MAERISTNPAKRSKWNMPQNNLAVGDVVLFMDKKFH
jgi:hypothetical protein